VLHVRRCAMTVEDPSLRVRRMSFASMPEGDLLEAIRWNFREHISVPIEEYRVGYTPLPGYTKDGMNALMAYGISEEAIKTHTQFAKDMGFKLISLEPAITAILACFHANKVLEKDRYTVCLEVGETITHFVVLTEGLPLYSRPLPGMTLEGLIKLLMKGVTLKFDETKELLIKWIDLELQQDEAGKVAFLEKLGEHSAAFQEVLTKFLSDLVLEVQRSIDAFCIMYEVEQVHELYLCGAGIEVPGLVDHIQHTLGVSTDIFDPFTNLPLEAALSGVGSTKHYTHAVATGLAIV